MSKLTEVLKLLCYDPETDGNLTFNVTEALTKNWEKIDQLVLLAVAAAAAYDPEGSYAVGDYCTHGGKLHKCGTPIPDGEAWNAEHWTETSVAEELAEVHDLLAPLGGATTPQAALAALGAGVRPNLLDNAIFVGGGTAGKLPVNQRGKTIYSYEGNGSAFDRWKIRDDQTVIEFEDDCIVIKNGKSFDGAVIAFGQTLEKSLSNIDSDITISSFVKEMQGDWYIACNSISASDTKLTIGITEKYFPIETVNQAGKELYIFKNSKGDNDYIKIKAVKIEQWKNQSLAYQDADGAWHLLPQPDSDYATQLAKCQRYFRRFPANYAMGVLQDENNAKNACFRYECNPPMRTTPVLSMQNQSDLTDVIDDGRSPVTPTSVVFGWISNENVIGFYFGGASGNGGPGFVCNRYIDASAEL